MKFTQITNELYGAVNAGYEIDRTAERQIDAEALQSVRRTRGETCAIDLLDGLYDLDGDLYRGDDGEFYAVAFDYGKSPAVPVCWHRLKKRNDDFLRLEKIIVRSETVTVPAHTVGKGTWAEMVIPEKIKRRYVITRIFADGSEKTLWTNLDGEGLFSADNHGAEYQITGTCQFCISGSTISEVKRSARQRFLDDINRGAELEFDFHDF